MLPLKNGNPEHTPEFFVVITIFFPEKRYSSNKIVFLKTKTTRG
jgi:hypothetical protein